MSILRPVAAAFALTVVCLSAATASAQTNVMFIFDASGSMRAAVGNDSRINIAKKAMETALKDVPQGVRLGLLMYGHRRANDCTDIELVSPVGADDAAKISRTITAVQPKGETPIAEALRQAARNFATLKGQDNSIVLVTDGIEECKGDPCAAAREIKAAGLDLKVHIVGFTLNDAQRKAIQCVPDTTGGKYFEARDASGLNKALGEVKQQTAQAAPPVSTAIKPPEAPDNLLHPAAGGRLIVAPRADWAGLADGKADRIALYRGEGIWAFKDGKPATFEAIEFMVPEAGQYNIKDVELSVNDDGPGAPFKSVGTLTVQNMKMMNSPYQRFTIPSTTARFIKIAIKSDWGGGYAAGYEIQLKGKVDEAAAAGPAAAPATGVDLLAPANGGKLAWSGNAEWLKVTNGRGERATTYATEAAWSFKDGKPATFDRIEVLIPATEQYNVRTFEVWASDQGATGPYRSLGTFNTVNARMIETPFQAFALPKTTARFVKVSMRADWGGGYVVSYGIKLMGTIDEAAAPAPPPAAAAGTDLIAAGNGGMLLGSSNDEWKKVNTGSGAQATVRAGEGIWAFKDEKEATVNAIEILLLGQNQYNLKDFEVLVSTDGPMGPFKSLGSFTTLNGRMEGNNHYQRFELPATKAKYVKLQTKTDWGGGYINVYGVRVMGTP